MTGTLTLQIHVWMISAEGIKPNGETVLVYSLSLYNFDQNKSFNVDNYWMDKCSTINLGVLKTHPRGGADGKNN